MWTQDELTAMQNEENLYISFPDANGTMHKPTWIWGVVADGAFYARSYNGTAGRWYAAAHAAGKGHISIGGVDKDVTLEFPNDEATMQAVGAAYEEKYGSYRGTYLEPMLAEQSVAATVRFVPKS